VTPKYIVFLLERCDFSALTLLVGCQQEVVVVVVVVVCHFVQGYCFRCHLFVCMII